MTAPIAHMVCGCFSTHRDGCVLGEAEQIALTAAAEADNTGGHALIAALKALHDAGLLRWDDLADGEDQAVLEAVLDALYEVGAIGRRT